MLPQSAGQVGDVEMSTLTKASREWSSRPADERFSSLAALHQAVSTFRAQAKEAPEVPYATLRTVAEDGDVLLVGKADKPARMSNWAFGQLASRVGAPAGYLRGLPATLAVQNLNHGLANRVQDEGDGKANILLHQNGGYTVRAFTSDSYTRIWNSDVTSRLIRLTDERPEWQPAPAAFDGSRGLYASDHDMFAFLVDSDRRIFEKAPGGGLSRGFFAWNSEVGAATYGVMGFHYAYVCGNHMVWGASGVSELRIRHVGSADERAFRELAVELRKYAEGSAQEDELVIERAQRKVLGASKDEVLDAVFKLRVPGLSRRMLAEGYRAAEEHQDWYGDPRTVWGMVNGITERAREIEHADKRVEVERAAGKLMQVAF